MKRQNNKIRIAVQNQGRLMDPSLEYLKSCGLKFSMEGRNLLLPCENRDIEILFVRSSDIPVYVKYGVADFGIVGENVLWEKAEDFVVVKKLDFGKCSLVIAVSKNSDITSLSELENERIATSYPNILRRLLKEKRLSASLIEIQGSVEICPALNLSDAIFDITQSGRTLEENGLKILAQVLDSQAVVIKNPNSKFEYEEIFL